MPRILLMSDLHFTGNPYYSVTNSERLELLLSDIKEEHGKSPLDMILLLGDYALDFWINIGCYVEKGISRTQEFFNDFLDKLPCPVHVIPGNHEQYGHAKWKEIAGSPRQFSVVLEDSVFLMLDNYALDLDPQTHVDGTYSNADVGFIQAELERYPDKRFFLCAHDFYYKIETPEFKSLVRDEKRIAALFAGHMHNSQAICLGSEYANKFLFRTGQYSYSPISTAAHKNWGFRDLNIDPDGFGTVYITKR